MTEGRSRGSSASTCLSFGIGAFARGGSRPPVTGGHRVRLGRRSGRVVARRQKADGMVSHTGSE